MSAATSAERSAGRRIADSVLDAVAAPLSFIDQSTSYSHHLEKRLLAEGKRRLLECLDRELATDLHEHYRSAHRTLISGFSQMESAYCRWRDDYIRQTLARLDRERQASGTPIPPERRRAYRFRARRFVKRHQVLLDLDRRRHSAANPMSVYEEIISEAPMCLAAFEALQSEVRRMVTPDLVDHYRRRFGARCLTLWQHAVEHVYGHTSPRPGPVELGADYGEDAPEEGNLRGLKGWLTRRAADDATRPLFDRHMERYLRGLVCNYESGSARARTDPGVDASMPPSGPRPDSAETTFRLLFPGRPWRRPTAGDNVRPPVELEQLQLIREIATETFRDFDECDEMSPWSLGRLQWIDRPMLRRIFTEIVERSPEPIPLTDVLEIVKRNRPPGRGFTDDEEPYITYHLQTVVAGFSQVIAAYHRAYRETLANQSGSDRIDDGRNGARNFGWSRLWPTIWSRESTALWTDREPFDGGVPLPVTYRLVFNQGHDDDAVESVMLVPLFPVKRTLASRPLREFFEYMHSGMVAVLPGDNQVARHPYRVAAALGQSVRLLRGIGRVFGLGGRLLWYRYGPRNSAGDTSARRLALWNSSARGLIRLGSQRHGTLDQLRASLLTALPRVLPDLPGPRAPREGRHQDWSPRGRREAKLRLMLTPVPHLMWCDTVYALGHGWRNDCGDRLKKIRKPSGMPTPSEALLVLHDTPVPPGPPPDTPVPPPDPDALREAKNAYRDALRDANATERETLREALRGHYSDGPLRRARRNAGLVGELLRLIRLDRTGTYWGAAGASDERLTIPLALELLEIFMLASLYFRPARPDLTVAAPARLAGRTTSFDLFGLTARAHIAGHRGLEMRLRVIAALVMAPLRLTRAEIREWANHGTHREQDAWTAEVHGLWGAELDRQEAELRESLRDEMQVVKAHEASAEPPAVSSILPEALRRSEPSTYNTLRDLFWDHMNWPLAGGKEPGR